MEGWGERGSAINRLISDITFAIDATHWALFDAPGNIGFGFCGVRMSMVMLVTTAAYNLTKSAFNRGTQGKHE